MATGALSHLHEHNLSCKMLVRKLRGFKSASAESEPKTNSADRLPCTIRLAHVAGSSPSHGWMEYDIIWRISSAWEDQRGIVQSPKLRCKIYIMSPAHSCICFTSAAIKLWVFRDQSHVIISASQNSGMSRRRLTPRDESSYVLLIRFEINARDKCSRSWSCVMWGAALSLGSRPAASFCSGFVTACGCSRDGSNLPMAVFVIVRWGGSVHKCNANA